jgi:HEAT repeat protein/lysophospholipase L1-like esterase
LSRLPRRLPELALASGTTLLLLVLLEGAARLAAPEPAPRQVAPYLWDWEEQWDGEFYTMVSRSVGWPPSEEFNGDGVRDRTHPVEKPPRLARVVGLGDSVTLGAGIPPAEAWPQKLQARLDAAGARVEVFNVGLWGWSTRQQRIAWQRIALRYRPDLVVLGVCLNDVPELQNNLARPPGWLSALHARSALVRLLLDAPGREIGAVEELLETPEPAPVREAFGRFFEELGALRSEVEAGGAELAVLVFPFRFQLEPEAPPPRAQERILAFCAEQGLRCRDLLPRLRSGPAPLGADAFVDYDHFSPSGTRAVVEELLDSGWLPGPPSHPDTLAAAGLWPDPAAAALAAALGAGDAGLRESALWAFARDGRSTPVEAAATALRADPDPGVRAAAARALGAHGDPGLAAESALYAALADASEPVRHAAARALHALGPTSGDAERLAEALASDDPYVQGFAAWSLGELGDAAGGDVVVERLLAALRDQPLGRGVSAAALARLGSAAEVAVPELVEALASPEPRHRFNAALALGRLGPRAAPALPRLVTALADPDPRVRAHAATALGRVGRPEAVTPLIRALEDDEDGHVRAMAARALGWLGPPAAAARPALERALRTDPHRKVQRHSRRALGRIGDEG